MKIGRAVLEEFDYHCEVIRILYISEEDIACIGDCILQKKILKYFQALSLGTEYDS